MEVQTQSPFSAALKPGITIGLVSLILTYLAYFIDSSLLTKWWFGLIALAIFFILIFYFGKQYRADQGGFISFGSAFNFSFIAIVISGLITLVGQILLYHVIDPALPEVLADLAFETSLSAMESFGANPDSLTPEQLQDIRDRSASGFTLTGQLQGFLFGLIFYAIIALILGAILKKRDKSLDY